MSITAITWLVIIALIMIVTGVIIAIVYDEWRYEREFKKKLEEIRTNMVYKYEFDDFNEKPKKNRKKRKNKRK